MCTPTIWRRLPRPFFTKEVIKEIRLCDGTLRMSLSFKQSLRKLLCVRPSRGDLQGPAPHGSLQETFFLEEIIEEISLCEGRPVETPTIWTRPLDCMTSFRQKVSSRDPRGAGPWRSPGEGPSLDGPSRKPIYLMLAFRRWLP